MVSISTRPVSVQQRVQKVAHLRDLLSELIVRDLKIRYQRSLLGIAWSWLKPLAQLLVLYFVFDYLMPMAVPNYATFLFAGVLAWNWFGSATVASASSITSSPELVRRPGFPTRILPALVVSNEAIHFVLALPILLVVAWWQTGFAGAALLALPIVVVVQFLFTLSLCYGIAASHVRFRDTQDAVGIVIMVAFYLTPVFYSPGQFASGFDALYLLNPMAQILGAYRAIVIEHSWPNAFSLLGVLACSGLIMFASLRLFEHESATFVEEL